MRRQYHRKADRRKAWIASHSLPKSVNLSVAFTLKDTRGVESEPISVNATHGELNAAARRMCNTADFIENPVAYARRGPLNDMREIVRMV